MSWKDSPGARWGGLEGTRQGNWVFVRSFRFAQADAEKGGGAEEDEESYDNDGCLGLAGAYHAHE